MPTPKPKVRFAWARRRFSHEFRLALLLIHGLPRGHADRIAMAHSMRKTLGRNYNHDILTTWCSNGSV
jgi:hypothetical protein